MEKFWNFHLLLLFEYLLGHDLKNLVACICTFYNSFWCWEASYLSFRVTHIPDNLFSLLFLFTALHYVILCIYIFSLSSFCLNQLNFPSRLVTLRYCQSLQTCNSVKNTFSRNIFGNNFVILLENVQVCYETIILIFKVIFYLREV